jgi:hypothetical protein
MGTLDIILTSYSVVCHPCRRYSIPHYTRMVRNASRRCAKDPSDGTRPICGFDVDLTIDGYHKEFGGKATSRLVVALQTCSRYTEQCAGRMDCLYGIQPAYSARGMAELS